MEQAMNETKPDCAASGLSDVLCDEGKEVLRKTDVRYWRKHAEDANRNAAHWMHLANDQKDQIERLLRTIENLSVAIRKNNAA